MDVCVYTEFGCDWKEEVNGGHYKTFSLCLSRGRREILQAAKKKIKENSDYLLGFKGIFHRGGTYYKNNLNGNFLYNHKYYYL
jgi:hypothetical protein